MMWDMPVPLLGPVGVAQPPIVPIAADRVSNAANFDIAWGDREFEEVNILIDQWAPASNGMPDIFTSSDNGASFDAGASDYRTQSINHSPDASTQGFAVVQDSFQPGYNAGGGIMFGGTTLACFLVTLWRPYDSGLYTAMEAWGGYDRNTVNNAMNFMGAGFREELGMVNAVRIAMTAGNVSARYFAWGALPL